MVLFSFSLFILLATESHNFKNCGQVGLSLLLIPGVIGFFCIQSPNHNEQNLDSYNILCFWCSKPELKTL